MELRVESAQGWPSQALGEKLGEGGFSEVYAWAPGQVVKLFKAAIPRRIPWWEARVTQAVFEAGGPAPEVLDMVKVEGRRGILLRRLEGPTLLRQLQAGAATREEAGAILAALAVAVHRTPAPADALPMREYMEVSLQQADAQLPAHIGASVLSLIDRLPVDDRLCHCDLHPDNVIVTPDGPRLIDWTGVKRGGAPLDLACSHFLMTDLLPESLGAPGGQRAVDAALQAEYARLAGLPAATLRAAVEAHLPVIRVLFLLGGVARPATRERLLKRLETDLRPGA